MATQAFWRGFRNRTIVSLLLLWGASSIDTVSLECAWSKLLARCTSDSSYVSFGRAGRSHGVRVELPEGVHAYTSSGQELSYYVARIARECTYIQLAAIVLPFLTRKATLQGFVFGLGLAVIVVGMINMLRLELDVYLSRQGWSFFWSHDIPHYACYTLTISGAVWYYYRSTVLCGDGNHADGAADGSPQTVNV